MLCQDAEYSCDLCDGQKIRNYWERRLLGGEADDALFTSRNIHKTTRSYTAAFVASWPICVTWS